MSDELFISIITPSLNRVDFIREAIESVLAQGYPEFEHIIMDGGSIDGTLDVVKQYPHLRVYSQADKGIYDAINRGISLAQGKVIGFLNTDDLYEQNVFTAVTQMFSAHPETDALVGCASILYEKPAGNWQISATFPPVAQNELLERATKGPPIFNAWFFRRRLFDEMEKFDTRYLYVSDREFLIRMAFQSRSYISLNTPIYKYRMHPGSYTLSGRESGEAEYMFETRALAEYYLRSKKLQNSDLDIFRTWHSQITVEQILSAWRKKAFGHITGYFAKGFHYNPRGWPRVFAQKFVERFSIFLNNNLKINKHEHT